MRFLNILISWLIMVSVIGVSPANAQINLVNIGLYPSAKVGSQYEIELGLTSSKNIRITTYLKSPKNVRVQGLPKLNSGSLRDGKWTLIFKIPDKAQTGKYRIYIKASAGKSLWVDQTRILEIVKTASRKSENSQSGGSNPIYNGASGDHLESLPSFVYGLKKSCGGDLGACPELTPEENLANIEICKIQDLTYPNDSNLYVSSAFTKPPYSLAGKTEVSLSWLPVSFKDRPLPDSLYQSAINTAREAEGFYEFNSYGRVDFTFTVPAKDLWIVLPEEVKFYENLWASMSPQQVAQYLIDRAGPQGAQFTDAIMFLFPEGKYSITKNSFYDRDLKLKIQGGYIPSARVYGIGGEIDSIGVNGFTHGIGHALYSFEDLYIFAGYSDSGKTEQPGNGWDVMIGGGEFFVWQRWHIGWLKDTEVNCLDSSSEAKTVFLEPFQSTSGKKLIAVKVNSSKVVLAEYRTNSDKSILKKYHLCQSNGLSQCESKYQHSGLLVYDLDTTRKHGAGPFRVSRTSKEKLVRVGESLVYEGHKFEVLGSDGTGIYVKVHKN